MNVVCINVSPFCTPENHSTTNVVAGALSLQQMRLLVHGRRGDYMDFEMKPTCMSELHVWRRDHEQEEEEHDEQEEQEEDHEEGA